MATTQQEVGHSRVGIVGYTHGSLGCSRLQVRGGTVKTHFHAVGFNHSCGLEGTILEVCIRADGTLLLSGLCAVCGVQFSMEEPWAWLMVNCAIRDYTRHRAEKPDLRLEDCVLVGKPN